MIDYGYGFLALIPAYTLDEDPDPSKADGKAIIEITVTDEGEPGIMVKFAVPGDSDAVWFDLNAAHHYAAALDAASAAIEAISVQFHAWSCAASELEPESHRSAVPVAISTDPDGVYLDINTGGGRQCDYLVSTETPYGQTCGRPAVAQWEQGSDEWLCAAHLGNDRVAADLSICPRCFGWADYTEPVCGACGHELHVTSGYPLADQNDNQRWTAVRITQYDAAEMAHAIRAAADYLTAHHDQ